MIEISRRDLSLMGSKEDVYRYVVDLIGSFGEWAKHVVSEERGVTTGNSGLVLHKRIYLADEGVYLFWFSLDPYLWEKERRDGL